MPALPPVAPATPATLPQALAALGVARHYRAGALLIQEGEVASSLFVIESGSLRAFCADERGREITLGVYGAGDYVGEMALDGGPRSANVEALEPSVCAMVTREVLRSFIATHPDFAFDMMTRLIARARLATQSVRTLALIDVYGRLTRLLDQWALPAQADGSRTLRATLTHHAMAQHIACSREMVSRLLKDLEGGGYVAVRQRRLVLLKPLPARW